MMLIETLKLKRINRPITINLHKENYLLAADFFGEVAAGAGALGVGVVDGAVDVLGAVEDVGVELAAAGAVTSGLAVSGEVRESVL